MTAHSVRYVRHHGRSAGTFTQQRYGLVQLINGGHELATVADQLILHLQGGTNGNGRRGIKLKRATPEQLAALMEEKRQVRTPLPCSLPSRSLHLHVYPFFTGMAVGLCMACYGTRIAYILRPLPQLL